MYTKVKNVMSAPAVTAHESTPYRQLVELLTTHKLSFLPIVDDAGKVVGVVSESDLVYKEARPHVPGRSPLLERRTRRLQRAKAAGTMAAELMTTPAVTIEPWGSATRAAQMMRDRGIRHLPVVDRSGQLVGVVSRGDLLRVFLRGDLDIEWEIINDVLRHELMLRPSDFQVTVHEGRVTLKGHVQRRGLAATVIRAVEAVEGVTHVDAHLTWRFDDVEHRDRAPWSQYGVA